ncbi:hypothetical protein QJS66_19940 [Kocuria rhizophila]|nr:hypothetical protein QJS66_19940 [Kocuria rhizophila]
MSVAAAVVGVGRRRPGHRPHPDRGLRRPWSGGALFHRAGRVRLRVQPERLRRTTESRRRKWELQEMPKRELGGSRSSTGSGLSEATASRWRSALGEGRPAGTPGCGAGRRPG